jgi:hypothetical protein
VAYQYRLSKTLQQLKQIINNYIEKTEILLKYSSDDLKPYIKPFLRQLCKLQVVSNELFSGRDGQMVMEQVAVYFKLLNEDFVDTDQLFIQLIPLTIKSVLLVKVNKELSHQQFKVAYKPFGLN